MWVLILLLLWLCGIFLYGVTYRLHHGEPDYKKVDRKRREIDKKQLKKLRRENEHLNKKKDDRKPTEQ